MTKQLSMTEHLSFDFEQLKLLIAKLEANHNNAINKIEIQKQEILRLSHDDGAINKHGRGRRIRASKGKRRSNPPPKVGQVFLRNLSEWKQRGDGLPPFAERFGTIEEVVKSGGKDLITIRYYSRRSNTREVRGHCLFDVPPAQDLLVEEAIKRLKAIIQNNPKTDLSNLLTEQEIVELLK